MNNEKMQWLAGQLRCPSGEGGRKVATDMSVGNNELIQAVIDRLLLEDKARLLEIGPGGGLHLPYLFLKHAGIQYRGIDISQEMINMALEKNAGLLAQGRIELSLTDGQTLAFEDAYFDNVFTVNTIYFWPEPAAYLQEIKRVLQPGGQLILGARSRHFMESLPFTAHGFTMYRLEDIIELLQAAGFVIAEAVQEADTGVPVPGAAVQKDKMMITAIKKQNDR